MSTISYAQVKEVSQKVLTSFFAEDEELGIQVDELDIEILSEALAEAITRKV